ncbi:MAG TPA: APC family permease [Tepidisphaeraceae bacterium]|jgi:amino acid transporter|nr:APC family permease [Tepidisphaeraceae bacterium]
MQISDSGRGKPAALALLSGQRPRNVGWLQAAGLLFGDWGTSRLYVLGIALFFAGRSAFWLIVGMSILTLAVGWAYTQICRIYPDGGGVYTAAKSRSKILAVVGALLLFADYTVTASLSSLEAFHYFGLPLQKTEQIMVIPSSGNRPSQQPDTRDAGEKLDVHRQTPPSEADKLLAWDSPGLWGIIAIAAIGLFNLMGPKHTGGFAIAAAIGMVGITLLITFGALPQINWSTLPQRIGHLNHRPGEMWIAFVSIVLALSGVEAIANLTGVMKKPVYKTAKKSIWAVASEVAIFNILLALIMLAIQPLDRDAHFNDMLAFLSGHYLGHWAELGVRVLGGMLLLSATNTALTDMISVQYLMARDGELPPVMQSLNRFGVPWFPAYIAAAVPALVLLFSHDLESLAALYAIGVIGAVAINISLCALHPRLRRMKRKIPMGMIAVILLAIWITLAFTKLHALLFVSIVMAIGLTARQATRWLAERKGKPSLLRQAIAEQLTPEALSKPRIIIGTYGSEALAPAALALAREQGAALVTCFIRQVSLSYKYEGEAMSIDTDLAAQKTFQRFLEMGHDANVPIIPVYDHGPDAAVLLAEAAAMNGCERILIGTSRRGVIYHLVKGSFQRRLENLLPPEIPVQVVATSPPTEIPQPPAFPASPPHSN